METIYFVIVVFLLSLAVFGLFVGVSNDAVNFLQSAVGARAAKFRTVLIYASLGVLLGAVMSTGMMDVARHGILTPVHYSFFEVMTIFFAVMVANVIILDMFNSVGMPTSSTISLVFGLLGASFSIATLKTIVNPSLDYNMLLNSGQALSMIIAIFVSVAFAFVFGWLIMWISRMVFSFNYKKYSRYSIAIFGGIAFTALSYFIFLKGVGNSPYMDAGIRTWINGNIQLLLLITFGCSTVFMEILHLFKVLIAGVIMVVAMVTSKKAQNVIKTSVDLSRQDGGDEMFGSSSAARAIVRFFQTTNKQISAIIPANIKHWIDSRFDKNGIILEDETAAFDLVRAAVTLVISSMLITIGTNYKLPLSTTYVTFMVAMGSSLADRAWSRESAVFRVTGVISVIGGWFITAGASFLLAAVICLVMYYGGIVANIAFIVVVIASLIRSSRKYKEKKASENRDKDVFRLMMRTRDPQLVWEMLQKQVRRTQSDYCKFALEQFNLIIDGLENEKTSSLRKAQRDLVAAKQPLKKVRRQEMLVLQRVPRMIAIERNTWFHLGMNSNQQLIYGLRRMLEPIKEHVDNSFNPLSPELIADFLPIKRSINELMKASCAQIETGRYENYRQILAEADNVKDELSILRKRQIDRMQDSETNSQMQVNLLYLNVLQESQQLLSNMRHQLRAAKKFME